MTNQEKRSSRNWWIVIGEDSDIAHKQPGAYRLDDFAPNIYRQNKSRKQ